MMVTRQDFLIFIILSTFLLNTLKVPFALILGLNHAFLSLLLLVIILTSGIIVLFFNGLYKKCNFIGLIFIFYHASMFSRQVLVNIIDGAHFSDYISAVFSFIRVLSIFLLYIIFLNPLPLKVKKYVWLVPAYLIFTTTIAFLQTPISPISSFLASGLSDVTSANHLGFFRSTGGVGGTVVDYSVYLTITCFFIYGISVGNLRMVPSLVAILLGLFFCFSRASFLTSGLLLVGWIFRPSSTHRSLKVIVLFLSFVLALIFHDVLIQKIRHVVFLLEISAGSSDIDRILGWNSLLSQLNFFSAVFGNEVGGNTGFYVDDATKVSGDGAIFSHLFDYGIIGVILLILVYMSFIRRMVCNRYDFWFLSVALISIMFVNSGIEKIFNYTYFFVALSFLPAARTSTVLFIRKI